MATRLIPVATATYGPNGKISNSLSFPYEPQNRSSYESGGKSRGVLVYEVPTHLIDRTKWNRFISNISCLFSGSCYGNWSDVYANIAIVDNTLENILANDKLHLENARPGRQNLGAGIAFIYEWNNSDIYANKQEFKYCAITTGRYIVVSFVYQDTSKYATAFVTGFALDFDQVIDEPIYNIENTYPLEENINTLENQVFTWERVKGSNYYNGLVDPVKHIISYRKSGTSQFTDITVLNGDNSYTFPAFTFDVSEYEYKITEYGYDDVRVAESPLRTFNSQKQYALTGTYPIDVNIKNSIAQTFTWMREAEYFPTVIRHTIFYRKAGETEFDYLAAIDGNSYQEVPANTFDVDEYEYYIVEYGPDDYVLAQSEIKSFNSVGQDDAPTITSVLNKPLTTVIWTASNQSAYELYIKDNYGNIIYRTDTVLSSQQYARINKFLTDGNYSVYVRIMNKYGIYSDWGSYGFVIQTSGHPTPSDVVATVTNKYGVKITGQSNAFSRTTYVLRRKLGADKIEVIGIKIDGESFIDYTAEGNTVYEYALRSYVGDYPGEGYGDSPYIPIEVKIKQVILQDSRDLENFIELYMSEDVDFNLRYSDERDRTLYNCLGRTYPVKESGEWINSIRTFTAYVTDEGFKKLVDIVLNAPFAYFKGTGEYFACDLTIADQGLYAGGGRLVEFTLTRISDDSNKLEIEG